MLESLPSTYPLLFDIMSKICFPDCLSLALQNLFQCQLSREAHSTFVVQGNGFLRQEEK